MDKKCQVSGCEKYVRQIERVGEMLFFVCNEHYAELRAEIERLEAKIASMTDTEMEERLEELNQKKVVN